MSGPVPSLVSDRLLLRRYATDRDLDAFQMLVHRHQADLLRLAHGLLGAADAAEDAVQEAFLRLVREAAALLAKRHDGEGLGGWLCTVCRNHCLDLLRRRQVLRFFSLDDREPEPPPVAEAADDGVWKAVHGLPALERAAVVLRYRDGLAYAEIAAQLGKSVTHVGLLLHQALGRLRACPALREGT